MCHNVYQQATDALKEAMKVALDSDIDDRLLSELWRHYLGVQSITKQLKEKSHDPITGLDFNYNPDYNIGAAQPADNIYGSDVITFS